MKIFCEVKILIQSLVEKLARSENPTNFKRTRTLRQNEFLLLGEFGLKTFCSQALETEPGGLQQHQSV